MIKGMILFFSVFIFSSFNTSNSYQTECVSLGTDGYVTLKIWDTREGANYSPKQARKDAIHAILFSGIAGANGCSTQPPILNKTEEQEAFTGISKSFFAKKGKWTIFARSSAVETTLPSIISNKNWKVYQVSVSKNELRSYLEDQKIIKSLSNGF
jgi:hypothetical protein